VTLSATYRELIQSNITLSGFPTTSAFLLAAVSTEITKQPVPIFEIFVMTELDIDSKIKQTQAHANQFKKKMFSD